MTAPSDFLGLDRFEDDGGSVERLEEQWDEPMRMGRCIGCEEPVYEDDRYTRHPEGIFCEWCVEAETPED